MKTLSSLSDYSGIDTNNEISLFEYGLLCKLFNDKSIHVWFGVQSDNSGNFNLFDCAWITEEEINNFFEESWFDKKGFLSYLGFEETEATLWINYHYSNKLQDLLQYYGYENIFGSSYYPIEIKNK